MIATTSAKMFFGLAALLLVASVQAKGLRGINTIKANKGASFDLGELSKDSVQVMEEDDKPSLFETMVTDAESNLNLLGLGTKKESAAIAQTEADQKLIDGLANTAGISAEEFVKMGNSEPEWMPHTQEEKDRAEEYMKLRRKRANELKVTNKEAGYTDESATVPEVVEDPNRTEAQRAVDRMLLAKQTTQKDQKEAALKATQEEEARQKAKREKLNRQMEEGRTQLANQFTNWLDQQKKK